MTSTTPTPLLAGLTQSPSSSKHKTVICGLGERGRRSLQLRQHSHEIVGFTLPELAVDTPRTFMDLPVVGFPDLSTLSFDQIVISLSPPFSCYLELIEQWSVPSELIEIEVESVFDQQFVRPESKCFRRRPFIPRQQANHSLRYFLINCEGRAGSRWLGSSLHMHPDIACSVGVDHPYNSFDHRYNEDERRKILMFCAEHPDKFSSSPYIHEMISKDLAGTGISLLFKERDFRMNAATMFDELDVLNEARIIGRPKALGNVHGTTCQRVASCISLLGDPFRGRKPMMVQLCRHPVTRFESRVSAHELHFQINYISSDEKKRIDDFCEENRDTLKTIEREYGADFSQLRDRLFFYHSRCIRYQEYWAGEMICYDIESIPFERLQSDPDYFAWLISYLTQNDVRADKAYLDAVFSEKNLKSGRGVAQRDFTERPPGPREQFCMWSEWQREEFRRSVKECGLQNIYAKVGYDFSFAL